MKQPNTCSISMEQLFQQLQCAKSEGNQEMMTMIQEVISGKKDKEGIYEVQGEQYIFPNNHPIVLSISKINIEELFQAFGRAHIDYNHAMKKELGALLRQISELKLSDDPEKEQKLDMINAYIASNESLFHYIKSYQGTFTSYLEKKKEPKKNRVDFMKIKEKTRDKFDRAV